MKTEQESTTTSTDGQGVEESAVESAAPPRHVIHVAVGSTNPVKVNAVRQALQQVLTTGTSQEKEVVIDVQGFSVPSGVPDQPFGDEETRLGAKNRAENAHAKYKEVNGKFPHLAFGLEGGLEWSSTILDSDGEKTLWCMAWMAIFGRRTTLLAESLASSDSKYYSLDKRPISALSKTATFILPSTLKKFIEEGMELGHADDKVFGTVNSKQKSGTIGKLTDGLISRTAYYEQALIMALIPWIRPDVYSSSNEQAPAGENDDSEDQEPRSFVSSLFCSSRKK